MPVEKSSRHHFRQIPSGFSVDPSDKKYPGLITNAGIENYNSEAANDTDRDAI